MTGSTAGNRYGLLSRAKLPALIGTFAYLIAAAGIANSPDAGPDYPLIALRELIRSSIYALVVMFGSVAFIDMAKSRKVRVDLPVAAFVAFLLLIALKFWWSDNPVLSLQYLATAALYGSIFSRISTLDGWTCRHAVFSVALANLVLIAVHFPMTFATFPFHNGRFFGLYSNANILAYAVAFTSLALPAVFAGGRTRRFALLLAALAINAYIIYLTRSRGALVVFGASTAFAIWILSRRLLLLSSASAIIAAAVFHEHLLNSSIAQHIFAGRFNTRAHVVERQIERFSENVVFGGPWQSSRVIYGENLYLGAAAELGILGLACIVTFVIAMMWRSGRAAWEESSSNSGPYVQTVFVFAVLLCAAGLLESLLLGVVAPFIYASLLLAASVPYGPTPDMPPQRTAFP